MKTFIVLLAALFVIGTLAVRPYFSIAPLDWTAQTIGSLTDASLASAKDLLVYFDTSINSVAVRRRNSEGGYDLVANISDYLNPQVRTANGKWIWTDLGNSIALWTIDASNQLSNASILENTKGGNILSDDTYVGYAPNEPNPQIITYEYQAAYNNWTAIESSVLNVMTIAYTANDVQSYRVYDNHLVLADITDLSNASVQIYERQADKSWKLNDTVPVDTHGSSQVGVHYNGVDTVVFVVITSLSDGSSNIVYIYTKKNGVWNEQMFNTTSLGYIPEGIIGVSCAFIDADTLLIAAPGANYYNRAPFQIGKVLMMKRTNGGDWTPHIDIVGNGGDIFGVSIAVNDHDLVVYDHSVVTTDRFRVFTAPLCFAQPMNVTCSNTQLNDCSSLTNTQLYTVNSSPRCGAVTPFLNGISLVDQMVQAEFTFTRFDALDTFSCNATVTCPSLVVPVTASAPVKAPTAKTSGGSMMVQSGLAALGLYLMTVSFA